MSIEEGTNAAPTFGKPLAHGELTEIDINKILVTNARMGELLRKIIAEQRDWHLDALVDLQKASQELDEIENS